MLIVTVQKNTFFIPARTAESAFREKEGQSTWKYSHKLSSLVETEIKERLHWIRHAPASPPQKVLLVLWWQPDHRCHIILPLPWPVKLLCRQDPCLPSSMQLPAGIQPIIQFIQSAEGDHYPVAAQRIHCSGRSHLLHLPWPFWIHMTTSVSPCLALPSLTLKVTGGNAGTSHAFVWFRAHILKQESPQGPWAYEKN